MSVHMCVCVRERGWVSVFWFMRCEIALCQVFMNIYLFTFFGQSHRSGMEHVRKKTHNQFIHTCALIVYVFCPFHLTLHNQNIILTFESSSCHAFVRIARSAHTSYLLMIWYPKHFIKIEHKASENEKKKTKHILKSTDSFYTLSISQSSAHTHTHSLITVAIIYG